MAEPGATPTGSPHILVLPWSCHLGVPPIRKQACLSLETQFRQRDYFQVKEEQMGRLGEQGLWVWGRGTLGPGLPGKGLETSLCGEGNMGVAVPVPQRLTQTEAHRPRWPRAPAGLGMLDQALQVWPRSSGSGHLQLPC